MAIYSGSNPLTYTSDGTTEVIVMANASCNKPNENNQQRQAILYYDSDDLDTVDYGKGSGSFEGASNQYPVSLLYQGTLPAGTYDLNVSCASAQQTFIIVEEPGGGGGSSSPYMIDLGSTLMLGGILMFLIAYWFIGLTKKTWNS